MVFIVRWSLYWGGRDQCLGYLPGLKQSPLETLLWPATSLNSKVVSLSRWSLTKVWLYSYPNHNSGSKFWGNTQVVKISFWFWRHWVQDKDVLDDCALLFRWPKFGSALRFLHPVSAEVVHGILLTSSVCMDLLRGICAPLYRYLPVLCTIWHIAHYTPWCTRSFKFFLFHCSWYQSNTPSNMKMIKLFWQREPLPLHPLVAGSIQLQVYSPYATF